jgi:hypothetical protein
MRPDERARYLAMREELARSLVAAQGLQLPAGQNARKHFRVAQLYNVEIANLYNTVTRELSRSGFSANVTGELKTGDDVDFKLLLSRGSEPISARARVVAALKQGAQWRVSLAIDRLNEGDAERLEVALFDAVLARIK